MPNFVSHSSAQSSGTLTGETTLELNSTDHTLVHTRFNPDGDWETELLTFLSELELQFDWLTAGNFRSDPLAVVAAAGRVLRTVDRYVAQYAPQSLLFSERLDEARRAAERFHGTWATLPAGPTRRWFGYGKADIPVPTRNACVALLSDLPRLLEVYLLVLGNGYTSGPAAAKWVETCGIFVRQTTKRLTSALR